MKVGRVVSGCRLPQDPVTENGTIKTLTSERALAEFRVSVGIWLPYMSDEDKGKALDLVAAHFKEGKTAQ